MKHLRNLLLVACCVIIFSHCSEFKKLRKSDDWRIKYEAAENYFNKKDYYRASVLLNDILPIIQGEKEGEKAQFYYAYCHFYEKQYILSAHYFKKFYQTYSRSDFAEEARFMHAFSLYKQSPEYNLDQTSTYEAIDATQTFLNTYSESKFRPQAESIINQLQKKLEKKAFQSAKLFYKLRRYRSAVVAFNNFQIDFPDSDYNEEISYLKILASYEYAKSSIVAKQEERFNETLEYYEKFIDKYQNSSFSKDAERIYENTMSKLEKLSES